MGISVGTAVSNAIARTRIVLFRPFDVGKWFTLGFCAFLSQCDSGGGGGANFSSPGNFMPKMPSGPKGPTSQPQVNPADQVVHWIGAHLGIIISIGVAALALGLAVSALISWLSSRGKFMFIDGIVHNRGAVAEPWGAFRELGNSLFMFSFGIGVLGLVLTFSALAIGLAIAWPDVHEQRFGGMALAGTIFTGTLLLITTLSVVIMMQLLNDFVVPAMYLHNIRVMPAWRMVRAELFAGYVGQIVLFYLMKIVIGILTGILGVMITCATCCVTAIPYVGTVVLLPLIVFRRCYGLCFIEQFGPRWTVFFDPTQRCQRCGYDLRYTPGSPVCAQCGTPVTGFVPPTGVPPTSPPQQPPPLPPTAG